MRKITAALFVIVGLVNLAPVVGVLSASRLEALYGVSLGDPSLIVLLRHRAVLFGIVGALLITAAVRARLRPLAVAAGFVSMLSFLVIARNVDGINSKLEQVVAIDLVASLLLALAAFMEWRARRSA